MKTGSGESRKEGRDYPMDFQRTSVLFKRQTWCCSVQHSAACLKWVLHFRRKSCWIATMLKSCAGVPHAASCPLIWMVSLWAEIQFWGGADNSCKWEMVYAIWNPLFQAEHTHAWSDSCGNWTLQVVRIFQSLAGKTCLNPLNFSKQDAGERERSWQGIEALAWLCKPGLQRGVAVPSLSALAFRSWHWAMPDWPAVSLNSFCVCDTESCSSARGASLGKQVRPAPSLPRPAISFILPCSSRWGSKGAWIMRSNKHSWTFPAAEEGLKGWSDNQLQAFSQWKWWVERENGLGWMKEISLKLQDS